MRRFQMVYSRSILFGAGIVLAATCIPTRTLAQGVKPTIYATYEHASDDVGIALLGLSFTPPAPGWNWVGGVSGYHLTYPDHRIASGTPYFGVRNRTASGEVSFKAGYNIVQDGVIAAPGFVPVERTGTRMGMVGSFQGNYWGTGGFGAELISDYNFAGKSMWDRGRLNTRIVQLRPHGQIRLGGEAVYFHAPTYHAWQAAPTLEWLSGRGVYITGAVGKKWSNYLTDATKHATYFAIDFVWTP
jgi:hypothetical protein